MSKRRTYLHNAALLTGSGLVLRLLDLIGPDETQEFLRLDNDAVPTCIQVNPLKTTAEDLERELQGDGVTVQPHPWLEGCLEITGTGDLRSLPAFREGRFLVQDAAARLAAMAASAAPGDRVLDVCAAPGGKTTQIAGRMMGRGFLLCNEINPKRAKILSRNIERMAVSNALVTNEHPATLAQRFAGFFDRVLVDAPCSGEGMFRKEEAAVTDWSQETVEMCARRQAEILSSAAALIRPGGHLVYSTCTFSPEEDEQAVARFLEKHPDFAPETVDAPWFEAGENGSVRLWPHKLLGEGHFAAVLRKMEGSEESTVILAGEKLPKTWQPFAASLGIRLPDGKAATFGDTLYWAPPDMPDIRKLKVLRPGLELGTVKKDRFEPAHALALWLKTCENQQDYPADSGEISAYLRGDVVPSTQKGWCLVSAGGYSIGWGKGDGRVLKNHYPKGLRR